VGRTLKIRTEAPVDTDVVHSSGKGRGVCGGHGKRPDRLSSPIRLAPSFHQYGRAAGAIDVSFASSTSNESRRLRKVNYEYVREGVFNVFIESQSSWRELHVSKKKKAIEWALYVQPLVDLPRDTPRDVEWGSYVSSKLPQHPSLSVSDLISHGVESWGRGGFR